MLQAAQTSESYPSGPSLKNPRRNWIVGGYVINNATCVAWGSRILSEPLDPEAVNGSMAALWAIMRKLSESYMTHFAMFGPESYKQYMIVTQSSPFCGWVGMNPQLIPKFEEGEREAIAREFLEVEGAFTLFLFHLMLLVFTL